MIKTLRTKRLAKRLRRTRIADLIMRTSGDWRYPFIALGWGISKLMVPRRKVVSDGVEFNLSCTNWITHFRWYLFNSKEMEVRKYINDYVKDGDVFFDIGANVGVFTVYCAKRYPSIRVYSFEPEYSNLYLLKENVIHNHLNDRVKITSVAISDFVGLSQLNIQDLTPGAAVHTENRKDIRMTDEGYPVIWSEGVATVTVDYVCEQMNVTPSAIKIDTDGNEDKVLRGAKGVLASKELRSLVIEMPHDHHEKHDFCRQALKDAGLMLAWSNPERTKNEIWVREKLSD